MRGVSVHGFNVKDKGARTVDKLTPCLTQRGFTIDSDECDYGYFGLFAVRLFSKKRREQVIQRLQRAFEKADFIVTHSNGANFATQALNRMPRRYRRTKLVIHISPALDRNTDVPFSVKKQLVLHTPHDMAVRISSYLPFGHPWGRMGAFGHTGHPLNKNIEMAWVKGHSDWFLPDHRTTTCTTIYKFVEENA